MAKTPKLKQKPNNPKSRLARRAATPDLPTKSLPSKKEETHPTVLAARANAGVTKKSSKKRLTHKQRLRREKVMERAEDVFDKLEAKVNKSKGRGRKIQERRKGWENVNGELGIESKGDVNGASVEEEAEVEEDPVTAINVDVQEIAVPELTVPEQPLTDASAVPLLEPAEDGLDEIL